MGLKAFAARTFRARALWPVWGAQGEALAAVDGLLRLDFGVSSVAFPLGGSDLAVVARGAAHLELAAQATDDLVRHDDGITTHASSPGASQLAAGATGTSSARLPTGTSTLKKG